jgi:hypothetical protein
VGLWVPKIWVLPRGAGGGGGRGGGEGGGGDGGGGGGDGGGGIDAASVQNPIPSMQPFATVPKKPNTGPVKLKAVPAVPPTGP